MVATKLRIPKLAPGNDSPWRAVIRRVMLCLALVVLIGGIARPVSGAPGDDRPVRIYSRQADAIWVSDDAGISWSPAGALPSRPLSVAAARQASGPVFVGTESLGLLRSNDGGDSWQAIHSAALGTDQGAAVAVTALAINPEDVQIIYAAINVWLGTNTAHLTPIGVAISVDGGRQWLQMSRAQPGDLPLQGIEPVAGQPLTVMTLDAAGSHTVRLELTSELLRLLQDAVPAVRASAARGMGLTGDPAALPVLMGALSDPDALVGQRIAEAIGRTGDRSVINVLIDLLTSGQAAERTGAALALGLLKAPGAVPGLAVLLADGDAGAQRVAAEALAAIGTRAAIAALIVPLGDPGMTSAQNAAMGGLELAGQPAVGPLVAALLDASAVLRGNAAEMLGWLAPIANPGRQADAVAALARLLADPVITVRTEAAWALDAMDTEQARLALNPAPIVASNAPSAGAPLQVAELPDLTADVSADPVATGAMATLLLLAMVAGLSFPLVWRAKRSSSRPGHT